jgi:hypothetical protein
MLVWIQLVSHCCHPHFKALPRSRRVDLRKCEHFALVTQEIIAALKRASKMLLWTRQKNPLHELATLAEAVITSRSQEVVCSSVNC